MEITHRAGDDYDQLIHCVLFGADDKGGATVPPYSTDAEVILEAIRAVFGQVDMRWKRSTDRSVHEDGHRLCLEVRGEDEKAYGNSPAMALCDAALLLAAALVECAVPQDMQPGLYWFRPSPWVPVLPLEVSDYGRSVSEGPIFVFSVSEPMPIYVREVRGQMVATGMERPLDWPRDTLSRGWAEIPLERLPGEIGPRIEPPADWHAEHHPEHLEAEPVVVVRRGEPEQIEYVDVWSGATVSVE